MADNGPRLILVILPTTEGSSCCFSELKDFAESGVRPLCSRISIKGRVKLQQACKNHLRIAAVVAKHETRVCIRAALKGSGEQGLAQAEKLTIFWLPWEDVEMDVEDNLTRRSSIILAQKQCTSDRLVFLQGIRQG